MKIKIYVEGGGDASALKRQCRRGFAKLFEKAGLAGRMPAVVACGGRGNAYEDFRIALRHARTDEFPVLLVDSEDAVTAAPWQHLKSRDNWDRPDGAEDDQVHLMVQCMETWFLADHGQLAKYFGQGFREKALPGNVRIEEISKKTVFHALASATQDTKTKGRYDKGSHSLKVLALIDPEKVAGVSPHARHLFDTLRKKTS